MTVRAWHEYVNPEADLGNPDETGPDEWNAGQPITAVGPCLLGVPEDTGTEAGEVVEIMLGLGLFFDEYGLLHVVLTDEEIIAFLGFTPEDVANKSTDATLGGGTPSDTLYPSQAAVKAYADQLIAAADAMIFKGVIDASSNPNYPAADRGWTYRISVAGKIGGASGPNVEAGDIIICLTDATASGDQATVGANWNIVQTNLDGAVIGPASAVDENFARFNGTSGKLIEDSGIGFVDEDNMASDSATKVPSQQSVKAYADTKLPEPSSTGIAVRTAADTAVARTIQGTANQIELSNGDGVSGNPVISAHIASQAEAEAGTDNVSLMTALRVAQAIAALGGGGGGVPSGTREDFQQTSAPTGWTKETSATYNDASPRIITGTVGTGGSVAFSTLFGRTAVDSYTLTSPADIPAHSHPMTNVGNALNSPGPVANQRGPATGGAIGATNATGSGGGHEHNVDMRVKFADFIIAAKD